MVAPKSNYQLAISNYQSQNRPAALDGSHTPPALADSLDLEPPASDNQISCALCGTSASRHITDRFNDREFAFCCYGCRHIYEVVAPDLARGVDLSQAMGRAGLDLNAPCCRGIIKGDPAEEAASTLSRLLLSAFLAMMVMVLSLALYSDFFFADWGENGQGARSMLQTITMLFATPAILLLALPILEDAIFTFQVHRRLTTSALIAVGSLAAYGLSVYATFTGTGHTYFETAVMTLLLVTVGRWLDARTQVEGDRALKKLLARTPVEASQILADGREVRTHVDTLRVGDRVHVRPGENFAVDGQVISGQGSVNEASITGESVPAYKGAGHPVYAGTTSLDGSFVVETTQVGDERVMGKLIRLLEEARLKRAPIEQLADRVAAFFTPIVIVLAAITFFFWTWQAGFEQGLLIGLAVLLIACPCALGIATPLAIWTALGRAAQKGVLIRDSSTLETLSHVRHVFFDKTGTLTTGESTLVETVSFEIATEVPQHGPSHNPAHLEMHRPDEQLLRIAASLEHDSEHPLARSIQAAAAQQKLSLLPAEQFRALPGLGVSGIVEGRQVFVGSRRLVEQQSLDIPARLQRERRRLEQAGLSVVHVGWAGSVQGLLAFAEEVRSTARPALIDMQQRGISPRVLTGDSRTAGAALSQQLGVPVQSELLPQDKVHVVENVDPKTQSAMVGDGLNDAPALARASVGIALGCGTDVTREAADISLLGNDLTDVAWTMALARRSYRIIGWNLTWAFAYNVIGVGLAMAGLLHPVIAAGAMVLSSGLVVGNSLRILRY